MLGWVSRLIVTGEMKNPETNSTQISIRPTSSATVTIVLLERAKVSTGVKEIELIDTA